MDTVFIGMGSNMNNPVSQLQTALNSIAQLNQSELIRCSSLYQSSAIGPGKQEDYINAVIEIQTSLPPLTLLAALQAIENQQGRKRELRWGPRTLDLDILLYGSQLISSEQLTVPHKELINRNFVLYPLAEIAPNLFLPNNVSLSSLLANCPFEGIKRIDVLIDSLTKNELSESAHTFYVKRASNV